MAKKKSWRLLRTSNGKPVKWFRRLLAYTPVGYGRKIDLPLSIKKDQELDEAVFDRVNGLKSPSDFYGVSLFVVTPVSRSEFIIDPDEKTIIRLS
jgi:hypothetical protein